MPTHRVAVEKGLEAVGDYLQHQGFDVIQFQADQTDTMDCDCCVISGMDKNVAGIEDVAFQGSVINADGMTPEEVGEKVRERVGEG